MRKLEVEEKNRIADHLAFLDESLQSGQIDIYGFSRRVGALLQFVKGIIEPSHPIRVAWDSLAVVGLAVDERGVISDVTPLFGPSEFLGTMENVVRRWEFEPARQAMERVAGGIVVAVYFPRPTLAQPRLRRPR